MVSVGPAHGRWYVNDERTMPRFGVVDAVRIGRICRALRLRRRWRQVDLAARAGCHQAQISRLERGACRSMTLDTVARIFAALDASFDAVPRWHGADLERLLDERHAGIVERVARHARDLGWSPIAEITYSEFGERGSIDLVAVRADARIVVVFEMKTDLPKIEETIRRHDEKVRLAPRLVKARLGWWPTVVGRVLVLPEDDRLRRIVLRHETTFRSAYPGTSRAVRRWLREPSGSLAANWFLSAMRGSSRNGGSSLPRRIRRTAGAPAERGDRGPA
jgi:transcriptional regulator with XRE-family HTH domain